MKKNGIYSFVILLGMMFILAMFTSCNDYDTRAVEGFFPENRINAWKKESKKNDYTMHGGYFLHYKGEYYPVEFKDGVMNWLVTPPSEMILIRLYELYTDPELTERCSYLGYCNESRLFKTDITHAGFLIDGDKLPFGTVLYFDESKTRTLRVEYGERQIIGVDDKIELISYNGNRLQGKMLFEDAGYFLSDEDGVFFEEVNTIRDMLDFARKNNISFDETTEYTGLKYPGSILTVVDNHFWQEDGDAEQTDGYIKFKEVEFSDKIHINLSYNKESYPEFNCIVLTSEYAIEDFYETINRDIQKDGYHASYNKIVLDEDGKVISCYSKNFFDKDQGAEITNIFYSLEDLLFFLDSQFMIDEENERALAFFSKNQDGSPVEGELDFISNGFFNLYAVWKPYSTVNLHIGDTVKQVVVCSGRDVLLEAEKKPGYLFDGWYLNGNFEGSPISHLEYENTHTDLYAKFHKVDYYTISFEEFEGKQYESMQYVYGDELSLPIPTKAFYVFKGWYTNPEFKGESYTKITEDFCGNYHLYPWFEPRTYTISAINNGIIQDYSVSYGENYFLQGGREGYTFLGYFDENNKQYTDEYGNSLEPFTDGADIHLYAKYKEE